MMLHEAAVTKATRRDWIGLAVIALPCILYAMDLTVLNLAIPKLVETMHPSQTELLWMIDIYGFLVAGSLITMGTLGDRLGRRRLLLVGAAAFGITSVVAAFATSPTALIASRAVLGLAGATLAPSTLSLIRNMFRDAGERSFAIGIWIASYSAGSALGPLVGGVLLEHFWAGSVFLLGVPVMSLLLVLGPKLLPEYRDPEPSAPDWRSAALSLAAVLFVIYGVKHVAADGFSWGYIGVVLLGLASGWVFLRRQASLAKPLVDLALFRAPGLSASLVAYTLATFAAFGVYVLVAQYLQLVLGLSPLRAGWVTLPFAVAFIVGSLVTSRLAKRFRASVVIAFGLGFAALGFAMLARIGTSLVWIMASLTVFSLGLAPVFSLATELVVGSAPPERAGAAAALSETGSELGGALGIAVLGSISTAVFRSHMHSDVPLGDALAADPLAAREAFTAAIRVASAIAAVLVLGLAVVAFALRHDTREVAPA